MAVYAGKVVIVTGASQGIGRALCLERAAQRPRLVLAARDAHALAAVAAECVSRGAETLVVAGSRIVQDLIQTVVSPCRLAIS